MASLKGEPLSKKPKINGKIGSIGPDGLPRLPPIKRPSVKNDPYAASPLMRFRLADHKQALLMQIL